MRRSQLEHAIRTACQIVEAPAVIVVGSQAILGTYGEEELPVEATMSMEVDVLPIADDDDEVIRLGDLIEGWRVSSRPSKVPTASARSVRRTATSLVPSWTPG